MGCEDRGRHPENRDADERNPAISSQQHPNPQPGPAIWDLVIADMRKRDTLGAARYGTRLQANNGRDALVDAYQEALDLVVYLRQAIEERDNYFQGDAAGLLDSLERFGMALLHRRENKITETEYDIAAKRLLASVKEAINQANESVKDIK